MKNKGTFFVVGSAAMWGCVSVFVHVLMESGISRLEIVALRNWASAIMLFLLCLVQKPAMLKIRWRDWWLFAGNGVTTMCLFSLCYWKSMEMVGVGISAVLIYTSPVFSLLISWVLFGERLSRRCLAAMGLSIIGVAFVSGIGDVGHISPGGVFLGILAGFLYAMQAIFGKLAVQHHYGSLTTTAYSTLACGVALTPLLFVNPLPLAFLASPRYPLTLVAMSAVCTVIPCSLFVEGLKSVPAGRASLLTSSEPGVALLIGVLVFQETLRPIAVVGIFLIGAAICLISAEQSQQPEQSQ